MKPMIILPKGQMSVADMKTLRENNVCVVEAKDPAKFKFVDPIPAMSCRNKMEEAAIRLSRRIINWDFTNQDGGLYKKDAIGMYLQFLVEGTSLSLKGDKEEQEQRVIDNARFDELQRIGREEAREVRKKQKEETAAKQAKPQQPPAP